jgi:hypothetical protein
MLTDFVAPAPEGRNIYSDDVIILYSSVRSDICQANVTPLGLKNNHPRFYRHFAPPGLGPQKPLAPVLLKPVLATHSTASRYIGNDSIPAFLIDKLLYHYFFLANPDSQLNLSTGYLKGTFQHLIEDQHLLARRINRLTSHLLPGVVRTYAPRGETPFFKVLLTRKHLSVMSGITTAGHLATLTRRRSMTGQESAVFLRHLSDYLNRKLLVIWDRLNVTSVSNLVAEYQLTELGNQPWVTG